MEIDRALARRLVAEQFPQWAHLSVRPVPVQGNDNRTFRLGDELTVRLPSAAGYVAAVAKEDDALPLLSPQVATRLPCPVAVGAPSAEYPWPWSVREWIPGTNPEMDASLDRSALAVSVGTFLRQLRAAPADPKRRAGRHSSFRGCHPSVYSGEVRHALAVLGNRVDVARCLRVWDDAVQTRWSGDPVWFHGDMATGNLLVREGTLCAVIDFGTCGVGDPACDLVLAWTFFRGEEQNAFAAAVDLDADTWRRARGWALWKALITLADPRPSPLLETQRATLAELLLP